MFFQTDEVINRTSEEQEELFKTLTEKALTGDHTPFEYIKNIAEWKTARAAVSGLTKVVEMYSDLLESLCREYRRQILAGEQDFGLICAVRQYNICLRFYQKELFIVKDMLKEYWSYVDAGHLLDQWLFFRTRSDKDLKDFRMLDTISSWQV